MQPAKQPGGASAFLPVHLSAARFAAYRRCCASDEEAVALYRWNLGLSGAVFEMLGVVEVTLRNAVDRELALWNSLQAPTGAGSGPYTSEWLSNPARPLWGLINTRTRSGTSKSTYSTARARARTDSDLRHPGHPRHRQPVTHDDALAHVMFGTWPHLLPDPRHKGIAPNQLSSDNRRRETARNLIWEQALHNAFPGQGGRYTVATWISRMHAIRNRVAHHEPLILTDVTSYHRTASRLLIAIDSRVGNWYASTSRVPQILARCPVDLSSHRL